MPRLSAKEHYLANIRLTERLICLEQVVGSLLTFLAGRGIIGQEDFGKAREMLDYIHSTAGLPGPPQAMGHSTIEFRCECGHRETVKIHNAPDRDDSYYLLNGRHVDQPWHYDATCTSCGGQMSDLTNFIKR